MPPLSPRLSLSNSYFVRRNENLNPTSVSRLRDGSGARLEDFKKHNNSNTFHIFL